MPLPIAVEFDPEHEMMVEAEKIFGDQATAVQGFVLNDLMPEVIDKLNRGGGTWLRLSVATRDEVTEYAAARMRAAHSTPPRLHAVPESI